MEDLIHEPVELTESELEAVAGGNNFGGPRSLDRNWADYKRESRRLSFPGYAARSLLLDAITFLS